MQQATSTVDSRDGFERFFYALWGKDPFSWQTALARRVLEHAEDAPEPPTGKPASPWPDAIALPTASGKTACMDVAVFALAAQASRLDSDHPITAPRRIFLVVDRRVIVDDAYERAQRLARKLKAAQQGILKAVADNLRRITHGATTGFEDEPPLAVHALRGGMYRSEAWARSPLQPTIVASTVDQLGSRLLFRAYGRSGSGAWPIYAALAANDSLVLLDEAHCAQPFLQTLQAVRLYQGPRWAHEPLRRSFYPVVMSATPPPVLKDVFRDESDEGRNPNHELGKRQLASKPARLKPIPKARGDAATVELAKALARHALDLRSDQRRAIVVFANRVATARETCRRLSGCEDVMAILLTGRMRAVDKDAAVRRLKELQLDAGASKDRQLQASIIVVATQTLEVGADLDFDGLVTECASLDALRQRFGRLNRMGRRIAAKAAILIRADQAKPKRDEDDPIYGKALTNTWKWLHAHANDDGDVDFGIAHLDGLLKGEESLGDINAPSRDAPVMLPAHVDCWVQTAPEPQPSPDVALFLHGPREGAPDVQACWRADLDLASEEAGRHALESLTLCPPSSAETLPVPIGLFRRWLAGEEAEDASGDVEGAPSGNAPEGTRYAEEGDGSHRAGWRVVRWHGARTDPKDITSNPADILPGDTVVIPTAHPGSPPQLGDLPAEASDRPATLDVGDAAHRIARAKPILRLHPALVGVWPETLAAKATARSLLNDLDQSYDEDPDEVIRAAHRLLVELSTTDTPLPAPCSWLPQAARELQREFSSLSRLRRECRLVGAHSLILAGRRRVATLTQEADSFGDEGDEGDGSSSGTSHRDGRPVPLRAHLSGVETVSRRHAGGCGLPEALTDAIARAGLLHDMGKADPRFQSVLRNGSPWLTGELLAKSAEVPRTRAARERARAAAGFPKGGRHELLSVRLAESAGVLLPTDTHLRDLVLHLIASHHGHCRPFAPVVADGEAVLVDYELSGHPTRWTGPTGLERLDSGVADRFWRLTRRYGWWGLAWLEALLRLADWRRSEWEEMHDARE